MISSQFLRPVWQNLFRFNGTFGLLLILLLGIPRFILVLRANVTGNYYTIAVIFVIMILTPAIFLSAPGRNYIGIKKPSNYSWLFYSFLAGMLFCAMMYVVAEVLFNMSASNWFVYISRSYRVQRSAFTDESRFTYFIIYALTAMTFSPVGEELFYRGIVHGSFAGKFGERRASLADAVAFAVTHLAHFGIIYLAGTWRFLFIPACLWVIFMFAASVLFFFCKIKTGSILGAIVCHAGFNLAMMYFIFYHVFKTG